MHSFGRATVALKSAVALAVIFGFSPLYAEEGPTRAGSNMGGSSAMNPAISLDGLFGFTQFNRPDPLVFETGHDPKFNGFNIQQVELTFSSNVDPYFRGDANLVLTAEGIEIEEAYATTLSLPWNLQVKAGQFYTAVGRQNPMHPHAWDFVNKPLVMGRFFGGDGLRNPGAQLSWLTPLPWYSEAIFSLQNSTGETAPSFRSDESGSGGTMRTLGDALAMGRLSNFFSLSDTVSLNFGATLLHGPNQQGVGTGTRIYGGDLYLKYRQPDSLSYIAFTAEVLKRDYGNVEDVTSSDWGWYATLDYRLGGGWERWHLGLRFDQLSARAEGAPATTLIPAGGEDNGLGTRWRVSPVVTFYPSEFSKLRLQYDYDKPELFETAQQAITLQLEFLIGSHGAHKF